MCEIQIALGSLLFWYYACNIQDDDGKDEDFQDDTVLSFYVNANKMVLFVGMWNKPCRERKCSYKNKIQNQKLKTPSLKSIFWLLACRETSEV